MSLKRLPGTRYGGSLVLCRVSRKSLDIGCERRMRMMSWVPCGRLGQVAICLVVVVAVLALCGWLSES